MVIIRVGSPTRSQPLTQIGKVPAIRVLCKESPSPPCPASPCYDRPACLDCAIAQFSALLVEFIVSKNKRQFIFADFHGCELFATARCPVNRLRSSCHPTIRWWHPPTACGTRDPSRRSRQRQKDAAWVVHTSIAAPIDWSALQATRPLHLVWNLVAQSASSCHR